MQILIRCTDDCARKHRPLTYYNDTHDSFAVGRYENVEKGLLDGRRRVTVEPVFGNIKANSGFPLLRKIFRTVLHTEQYPFTLGQCPGGPRSAGRSR
jgi:hypothetical protein